MQKNIWFLIAGVILGCFFSSLFFNAPQQKNSHITRIDTIKNATIGNISSQDSSLPENVLPVAAEKKSSSSEEQANATSILSDKIQPNDIATDLEKVKNDEVIVGEPAVSGKETDTKEELLSTEESAAVQEKTLSKSIVQPFSEKVFSEKKIDASNIHELPFSPAPFKFTIYKLGTGKGPTLLVIGGIQGDEPGGFSTASLLITNYTITSGSVWVVPDINFLSVMNKGRGTYGDMNRKFAKIDKKDPEYQIVNQIKSVLLNHEVDLVLNLHDGSGFYRPSWENAKSNPNRWGQSVIIDQTEVNAPKFPHLEEMAKLAESEANKALISSEHRYHVHNTNTAKGDLEMEKSLSYFVVCNDKAAFGIEASKEFTTEYRSYYQLNVVESFMRQMGISFKRSFPLEPKGVLTALRSNLKISLFNDRIVLPLDNVRPILKHVPFEGKNAVESKASHPLMAVVKENKNNWRVIFGNRVLTRLQPDVMPFDNSLSMFTMNIDGEEKRVKMGDIVSIKNSFEVENIEGYRVNAIGSERDVNGTEAGVLIRKSDFKPSFSIDKAAKMYRVEFYKGPAFVGMILVDFGRSTIAKK